MQDYAYWLGLLGWLADRAPPLLAGFIGGVLGALVIDRWKRTSHGQSIVEYGLIVAAIAIVVLLGVGYFGDRLEAWLLALVGRLT
ncbi:MAG: hypothetical protein J2P17_33120, partial [Mycobacterium sp.]|nr:hypothetical protein [Mycobacterium sp.]